MLKAERGGRFRRDGYDLPRKHLRRGDARAAVLLNARKGSLAGNGGRDLRGDAVHEFGFVKQRCNTTCSMAVRHDQSKSRTMCLSEASDHHPAPSFLPDLLERASHAMIQGFAEELRGRGMSLPVWRVMATLSSNPGQTVSDLAVVCLLQQPTMTKLLDRMARDGLVERAQDARDRRVVRVALTRDGEAKAAELVAAAERYEAEALARHPQAEGIKAVLRDIIARSGGMRHARSGGDG